MVFLEQKIKLLLQIKCYLNKMNMFLCKISITRDMEAVCVAARWTLEHKQLTNVELHMDSKIIKNQVVMVLVNQTLLTKICKRLSCPVALALHQATQAQEQFTATTTCNNLVLLILLSNQILKRDKHLCQSPLIQQSLINSRT